MRLRNKHQHSTLLFPSFSVSCCLHSGEERINLQVSADLVDSKLAFKIGCLLDQNQFFLRHHPPTISKMLLIIHSLFYMHCSKSLFILKILDMHSNSRIAFHTKKIGNISWVPNFSRSGDVAKSVISNCCRQHTRYDIVHIWTMCGLVPQMSHCFDCQNQLKKDVRSMTFETVIEYDSTVKFPCPTAVPDKYENVKCTGTVCTSLATDIQNHS